MATGNGGRDDGQDQHDPQLMEAEMMDKTSMTPRKEEKEGEAHNDGGDDGHDHAGHLQASTSTLSSSDGKSARDEEENCYERPSSQST